MEHLDQAVIYSIFVRNHTKEGTFSAIIPDLDRIRDLGTDIIWLMPIHPIGKEKRKGRDGSPYAIADYRKVNPKFGTLEEFQKLVEEIHARGMKCIIDVVYNHTSPDSWLAEHHPEYFYRKEDGSFGNKVADWSDIIDLDYRNRDLWQYQIDTLKQWAAIVDGFRCDVAPMVPVEFWKEARQAVEEVRPGAVWLAESGHPAFITFLRAKGVPGAADCELYQAFDLCYEYDTYPLAMKLLQKGWPVEVYADVLNYQNGSLPKGAVKMRFLENHDNSRIREHITEDKTADNWTALLYFQKGAALLYEGQEYSAVHRPSIFEQDPVDWETGRDISSLLKRLNEIKKNERLSQPLYMVQTGKVSVREESVEKEAVENELAENESVEEESVEKESIENGSIEKESARKESDEKGNVLIISYGEKGGGKAEEKIAEKNEKEIGRAIGFFCLRGEAEEISIDLPDGSYRNQIDGKEIAVKDGRIKLEGTPVVIFE